jgi:hypothetical protein
VGVGDAGFLSSEQPINAASETARVKARSLFIVLILLRLLLINY